MHFLIKYKLNTDLINSKREKVATSIFRRSREANSVVLGLIWSNFKLIQGLMCVIVTCKYGRDPMKNSRENVMASFSHNKSMGFFQALKGGELHSP